MSTTVSAPTDAPRELAPAGNHRAICCGVIDLGTQTIDFKNGKPPEDKHRVLLRWELADEADAEGRPLLISEEFTASLHENANLRTFLVNWRGRAFTPAELARFDLASVLGQPCLLSVVHEVSKAGRAFAKVKSAARLPRATPAPEPYFEAIHYQVEDGAPPATLPEWITKKIEASRERSSGLGAGTDPVPAGAPADDDCPF